MPYTWEMSRLWLLAAALLWSSPARAQESQACRLGGFATGQGAACRVPESGAFCRDLESCKTFCCCACSGFNPNQWNQDASCPGAPTTGAGMLTREQATAITALPNVLVEAGQRGTAEVIAGLTRLNDAIPALRAKYPQYGAFRAKVKNCWRSAESNTTKVCSLVIRKLHVEQSARMSQEVKAQWTTNAARVWGLTWPGPTPHSGGFACDVVLVDSSDQECFGWAVLDNPDAPTPTCAIPIRTASEILDEAATAPAYGGGVRLNYETWHYEWASPHADCRCSHGSATNPCTAFWPPKGDNNCARR